MPEEGSFFGPYPADPIPAHSTLDKQGMEGCKRRIAARRPSLQGAPLILQVETARLFPTSRILYLKKKRKEKKLSPANIAGV